MLMVIFGAGASYDSCPTYPPITNVPGEREEARLNGYYRLPLASELFANRPLFAATIERFPDCQPIIPKLRSPQGKTVEAALEELQIQAESYPPGRRELAAVKCYLYQAITTTQAEWTRIAGGISYYKSLLREIERTYPKEPVCLVTFNYDTLLEDALRQFGFPIASIEDYTKKHPFYRVFKLHGSTNWARDIETEVPIERGGFIKDDKVFAQLIERAAQVGVTDRYIFAPGGPIEAQSKPAFPAIAIPVEKKRSFECPPQMLEELVTLLRDVTQILVIGWRATEEHFLRLLSNKLTELRRGVQLYIVAGPKPANYDPPGEEVKIRICGALLNNPPNSPLIDPGGFTDFMLGPRAEEFLAD